MGDGSDTAWMAGFPPPPEARISFHDGSFAEWPQLRWTFSHLPQLVPTRSAWRGPGAARILDGQATAEDGSDGPRLDPGPIATTDGRTLAMDEALDDIGADGLVVLHGGRVVHEEYRGHGHPHRPHVIMSATKSVVGTLALLLEHDGVLDRDAPVTDVLPELSGTAWDDATVRHVLDMVVSMQFDEDYLRPDSEVYRCLRSAGMLPFAPDDVGPRSIHEYLPTVRPAGRHGDAFAYREPNIFVLGWLVRRASGRTLADLLSERIWRHLGAEHDATFLVESAGGETSVCVTTRDLARFGDLFRTGGTVDGFRVLPREVADDPFAGGDPELFARGNALDGGRYATMEGWSYRSQWWVRHLTDRTCPMARGAYGQVLAVDRGADMVVALTSSARLPPSSLIDPVFLPLMDAITGAVR